MHPKRYAHLIPLAAFIVFPILVVLLETAYLPAFADPMEMGYVDLARHLARGDGLATSMLAPYYTPRIPSPISLWPPLYPAAISGFAKLGIPLPIAARVVAIVAFGLAVGVVWLIGGAVFNRTVGAVSAALLSIWPAVTRFAAMAISENLFMLLMLCSVLLSVRLLQTAHTSTRRPVFAAAAGLAMGAASLTRYVGLALIAVGTVAMLLNLRGSAWTRRLFITALWVAAAAVPVALLLVRNVVVTGSLIGEGRPPNERDLLYHIVFSVKVVAADALQLLWRLAIVPEALGLDKSRMAVVIPPVLGITLVAVVGSPWMRRRIQRALHIPIASPEARFVLLVGLGYWAAMLVARTALGFMALSTRMMLPVYPLLLISGVAMVEGLTKTERRTPSFVTASIALILTLATTLGVILPRSVAAGGPRLRPDPPPPWVAWVAANTPKDAPIVGNAGFDYNFYLGRPVLSFASYLEYRAGDRFERDCQRIARNLAVLGWQRAYFILHAEDGGLDPDLFGRRYGPTLAHLLRGRLTLPLRPIARHPEFVAFEIVSLNWKCGSPGATAPRP